MQLERLNEAMFGALTKLNDVLGKLGDSQGPQVIGEGQKVPDKYITNELCVALIKLNDVLGKLGDLGSPAPIGKGQDSEEYVR